MNMSAPYNLNVTFFKTNVVEMNFVNSIENVFRKMHDQLWHFVFGDKFTIYKIFVGEIKPSWKKL